MISLVQGFPLKIVSLPLSTRRETRGRGGGEEGRPPLPFFENRKKCLNFWKKRHYQTDSVYLWVKFKNVVLRVSRRKKSKLFPARPFFILFLTNFLSKCPDPAKPPVPWNVSDCAPEHILVTWAKLDTSCCHYLPTIKLERDFKEFGCTLFHAASVH